MAVILNASSSGTGGLSVTSDATGNLAFQTAGTTAVTVDTNQRVAFVAGTAALPAITTSGDTNTGIFFPAADTIAFSEGGTESMRIDSSGRVGINTTSALGTLDTYIGAGLTTFGDFASSVRVQGGNDTNKYVPLTFGGYGDYAPAAIAYLVTTGTGNTKGALVFGTRDVTTDTRPTERMRIDSSGNLLVGTTSQNTNEKFGVAQSSSTSTVGYFNATAGDYSNVVLAVRCARGSATTEYNLIEATQVSTIQFLVRANGNVLNTNNSYGSLSDIKLKENIVDATPKLADLMQVKVRNYNLKSDPTRKQLGVIAQELEQVFPAMVEEATDKDEEGNYLETTTKSVKYSVFVPMLIKSIQELKAINDTQAETINALTARIVALEGR